MPEPTMSPKIGTLPDGRSYVTYPSAKRYRKETWSFLGGLVVLVSAVVACAYINSRIPAAVWHVHFLDNLTISDPRGPGFFPFGYLPGLLLVRWRGSVVLPWSLLSLTAVALIVDLAFSSTIELYGLGNSVWAWLGGFAVGDALRWSRVRKLLGRVNDLKVDIVERAWVGVMVVIALIVLVVMARFLLGGQWLGSARPVDWAYLACFAGGWLVSYILKPKAEITVPAATVR